MENSRPSLEKAMQECWLVRFARRFESTSIRGYVLDIGPEFFLLALVSDRIWFDGFECFRVRDVQNVRRDPHVNFVEAALKLRNDRLPEISAIKLGSVKQLLLSASSVFPLVTIHREEKDPDVCHIGHVVAVNSDSVELHEISPDATWDESPTKYRTKQITRINFGGDYENSLHLVGGSFDAR